MIDFEMFDANLNNIINYINLRSDYDKIDNYLYYIIDKKNCFFLIEKFPLC